MVDRIDRVNRDYLEKLASQPERTADRARAVDEYKLEHGASYGGEPIPTFLKPNFISPSQQRLLEEASTRLIGVLNRFVQRWLDSPKLQELWGPDEDEMELYRVDPGYPGAIQIARFDGFLQGRDLAFLEANCDSPGGPGYGDVIQEAFDRYVLPDTLGDGIHARRNRHQPALVEALRSAYAAWRTDRDRPEDPFIVLADWRDVGSRPDIEIVAQTLRDAGLDAVFADPRDLALGGDDLVLEDKRVDLLYKRVIVEELLEDPAARPLVEAYKAGTICMINSARSPIVGDKKTMAMLRHPDVIRSLDPEDREAVERFVPWTMILTDRPVDVDGRTVELRDHVLDHRERLVLKAARSYGGREVQLGFETDDETWGRLVDTHLESGDWVVQELVDIPTEPFPIIEDGKVRTRKLNVNINPFVFGGKYGGAYTRVSTQNVINVSHGGGLVPTITIDDEEGDR